MRKNILFILTLLFTSLSAQENKEMKMDSLSLIKDIYYTNPAFNFYRHSSTISTVNSGLNVENREVYLLQEGKGFDGFSVNASSWMALKDDNKIWGAVSYRKGKRKDVSWSETSDTQLLYPYVMADSVGGDLSGQRYLFNGGYAGKIKNVIIGGEIAYRAEIESRAIDPRPRNIISDLMVKAGASYNINKYQMGATLSYSSYNQKNDVDFYSQLGNPFIHTMTGLGHTYIRFDGTRTSAEYTGNTITSSIHLRPINNYGFWTNMMYTIDNKSRRLTSENDIPITEMRMDRINLSAAYKMRLNSKKDLSISLEADMASRKGKENLFNSGNGVSMEIIGHRKPYSENINHFAMHILYKDKVSDLYTLSLKPSVAMMNNEIKHDDYGRYIKYSKLNFGAAFENDLKFKKWELVVAANGSYQPVINSSISLPSLAHRGIEQMLMSNYNVLSSNRTNLGMATTAYLPQKGYTLFAKAAWNYELYNGENIKNIYTKKSNNQFELNIGILF